MPAKRFDHPRPDVTRPPKDRPAAKGTFEVLGRWAEDLGVPLGQVFVEAKITQGTAWRIMNESAGQSFADAIEAVLKRHALARNDTRNPLEQFREWSELGFELASARPAHFESVLLSARAIVDALPEGSKRHFKWAVRTRRRRTKK